MASWRLPVAVLLGSVVALGGWRKRALSADGAVAAALVGATTFGAGGLNAGAALVAFFVSGSWLSRRKAVAGEVAAAKGHRRDALQVLANGGVAALGAAAAQLGAQRGRGTVVGALAAAAADTWASEIGVRSPEPPRSIVTGRVVAPGTSGGVTALGWSAAAGGALLVGLVYALARPNPGRVLRTLVVALLSGLLGSLADSLVGATLEAAYVCERCGIVAETPTHPCGNPTRLVRGQPWVTNDVVNLVATGVGGLVGALGWSSEPCATLARTPVPRG